MTHLRLAACLAGSFVLVVPRPVAAQTTSGPLSQILPALIDQKTVINSPGPAPPGGAFGHIAHFFPDLAQQQTPRLVNNSLTSQLASFPVGSSSGGFTYRFDPSIGLPRRSSETFGPSFAERPLTNGRRQLSVGVNYQHTSYDSLEGQSLADGSLKFYVRHNDCCPGQDAATGAPGPTSPGTPGFEADVIEEDITLKVTRDLVSFFVSYGITDRLDVGIALPVIRASLDATVDSTILRLGTAGNPAIHRFPVDDPTSCLSHDGTRCTQSASGSATGIGDVALRGKYVIAQSDRGGLAGGIELRLPTGNEANLLGTGSTQTKLYLIAAGGDQKTSPHVNVGYTFSGGDSASTQPDEFNYVGGVDFAATQQLTVAFDVVGRTLRKAGRLQLTDTVFNPNPPVGVTSVTLSQFSLVPDANLNLLLGAVGVKYNITKTLLITANVLFPLTNSGLRPSVTPVIGFDYAIQ